MYKIQILTVGKLKEPWLEMALKEYEKRLTRHMHIHWTLAKTDVQLENLLETPYIALDPTGTAHTSESFSTFFQSLSKRQTYVIGGSDGLTPTMRAKAQTLISLSPLTFTHQLTRLILLEQLYRAHQIHLGTPYHK